MKKRLLQGLWLIGLFAALSLMGLVTVSAMGLARPTRHTQATPAPRAQRAVVGGAGAGLRDAPGGPVIKRLPLATALWVTGRTTDSAWLQVASDADDSGWVKADEVTAFGLELTPVLEVTVLAEVTPAAAEQPTAGEAMRTAAQVQTGGRNLILRQGPGVHYGMVDVAMPGAALSALARNEAGDWIMVDIPAGNDIAWASARYLQLGDDVQKLPVSERISILAARPVRKSPASVNLTGQLVFQTSSGGPIMLYDLAAGKSRQLTTGLDPAISPDGQTVAFIRDGGGDAGLYLIDIDGSHERRIFTAGQLRTPAWAPDGGRIVFSRVTGQSQCRDVGHGVCLPDAPWLGQFPLRISDVRGLSRVDVDGGAFQDIPAEKQAYAPDWGPDGIVYQSQAGLQVTADAPDAATRPLLPDFRYQDPAWRPDGGALIFVSMEKDHREIFRAHADGAGVSALTRPADFIEHPEPVQHVAPAWSPDGEHIVFLGNQEGDWALYVMNADGSNQRKLAIDIPISYRYQGEQVVSWGR